MAVARNMVGIADVSSTLNKYGRISKSQTSVMKTVQQAVIQTLIYKL